MKTIWSILVIVMFGFLTFQGLSLVMTEAAGQGNLNEESLNLIGIYDPQIQELENNIKANENALEISSQQDVDSNGLDQYFREYSEAKSMLTILKDGIFMMYNFPTMVINSVPFVDIEDLTIYSIILNLLVYISAIIAIYVALFRKEVSK